jgi:hypothetical protein
LQILELHKDVATIKPWTHCRVVLDIFVDYIPN